MIVANYFGKIKAIRQSNVYILTPYYNIEIHCKNSLLVFVSAVYEDVNVDKSIKPVIMIKRHEGRLSFILKMLLFVIPLLRISLIVKRIWPILTYLYLGKM